MTSNYQQDMDSGTVDSVSSTPRSEATNRLDDFQPRIRFMCSFGGQILPRPHDNQLRYVGGDTRIVAVNRSITYSALLTKLSRLSSTTTPEFTVKYQLPNEDLDALISVSTDEDVENMIDEYDRLIQGTNPKLARLRLFMFPIGNSLSATTSIGSLLDGSTKRENWFLDALNGGGGSASLDRVRSEASSIISEVPDYLFGLDNSEETRESKLKNKPILTDNVSVSDPGSPAPPISSPHGSNASAAAIPNLPHVKTKLPTTNPISTTINDSKEEPRDPMVQQQAGYPPGNPVWHYMPETHFPAPSVQQMPVYYMQSPVHHHHQVHPQPVHMQPPPAQYVQRFQAPMGQIPVGYRQSQVPGVGQMYGGGGGMRPVTHVEAATAYETYSTPNTGGVMAPEQGGTGQQTMYYGATRNTPMMQTYAAAAAASTMVQGGGTGTDHHQMQMQMQMQMQANPNNTLKDSQQTQ